VGSNNRSRGTRKCIQNFGQKPEGKTPLGTLTHTSKDNGKMDVKETYSVISGSIKD
jgi:hypothetical protein